MFIKHRTFFTGNELGYTDDEMDRYGANRPTYAPVVRARIRDTRQNCFWPSVGYRCPEGLMIGETDPKSCCNREAADDCVPALIIVP